MASDRPASWTFPSLDFDEQRIDSTGTIHPPPTEDELLVPPAALELGEVLGTGGMGEVRLARQVELQRDVAVKLAREERLQRELVLEATITGGLEHPGIVPVYGLQQGPEGPRLVMKRIEGLRWTDLVQQPDQAQSLAGERDLLVFHVEVLVSVCETLAYAHDRGVLHRDLKPDNVMVGQFGEVYVVDWGVAVSTVDDGRGLPLAAEVRSVAGTPAYMSPEQARGDGSSLGPRSDVYLLGALLFEVLSGVPPHPGENITAVMEAARSGRIGVLPEGGPEALRTLALAALAPDPADRPPGAHEVGVALRRWLDTRAADAVAHEAERALALLGEAVAGGGDEEVVERLITEARFGFRQALTVAPDHAASVQGARASIELAVRVALGRGDVRRASLLLSELQEPPEALVRQLDGVTEEVAREAAEVARMREVVADIDVREGRYFRARYGLAVGIIVGGGLIAAGVLDASGRPVGWAAILTAVLVFDVGIGAGILMWHQWWPDLNNRATRQLRVMMAVLTVLITVHYGLSWWVGRPIPDALAINGLLSGSVMLATSYMFDKTMAVAGGAFLASWVLSVLVPDLALVWFGAATGVAFVSYAVLTRIDEG